MLLVQLLTFYFILLTFLLCLEIIVLFLPLLSCVCQLFFQNKEHDDDDDDEH